MSTSARLGRVGHGQASGLVSAPALCGIGFGVIQLVAFGNLSSPDFFSARIGCQVFEPAYGMDLGALCIKRTHGSS